MTKIITRVLAPVTLALILAGCGGPGSSGEAGEKAGAEKMEGVEASEAKEGPEMLSPYPRSRSRTPGSRSRGRRLAGWRVRSSFRRRSKAIRKACRWYRHHWAGGSSR